MPSEAHQDFQVCLIQIFTALGDFSILKPGEEIQDELSTDIAKASDYLMCKLNAAICANSNVFEIVLDAMVNPELLDHVPAEVVGRLTNPFKNHIQKKTSLIQKNLEEIFGFDNECKIKLFRIAPSIYSIFINFILYQEA